MRILIIEDDLSLREALAASFARRGYSVTCASCPEDVRRIPPGAFPTLAILDLKLGVESGLTLIPFLVQAAPGIKIVALTGYASFVTAAEAIKLGAVHYLAKPADPEEIIAAFAKHAGDPCVPVDVAEVPLPAESALRLEAAERAHIRASLERHQGNISAAARELGMYRRTLQRKIAKLRLVFKP